MQYTELEATLLAINWKIIAEFFENKIRQEIVDLTQESQQLTLERLRDSQARIEAYREFIVLPSTIVSLNKREKEKSSKDVKHSS